MEPSVIVVGGPDRGRTLVLTASQYTIGRSVSSDFVLNDTSVSRNHCLLKGHAGSFTVIDCASRNGTFINGIPIESKQLRHGDQINVGRSTLLFISQPENEEQIHDKLDTAPPDAGMTLDAILRDGEWPKTAGRVTRDLHALLKVITGINSVSEPDKLQRLLLETLFEVVPADVGAIALLRYNSLDVHSVTTWRRDGSAESVDVPQHMLAEVIRSNRILVHSGESSTSTIAAPLRALDRVIGVLYVAAVDFTFENEHLDFASAWAGLAGMAVAQALELDSLRSANQQLRIELGLEHNLIGQSARIRDVLAFVAKVATSDATVLVTGETGTGKELVARAIHRNSARRDRPFVALNCATLGESLLESELFGHEKGAFTGAIAQKKGKLELADGGTVLLDEIGEMPIALQAKLLRFLQEREFERVGGVRLLKVDVRVIAATNRDLANAIEAGTFRSDLFYRLNVVSVHLPPLRERRDDINLLANYFAAKYGRKCDRTGVGISREARDILLDYRWPGNIRELENVIERAIVLGSTDLILPDDLPEALLEGRCSDVASSYHNAVNCFKADLVMRTLKDAGGDYARAAAALGLHPNNLHRLIRNLGLKTRVSQQRTVKIPRDTRS